MEPSAPATEVQHHVVSVEQQIGLHVLVEPDGQADSRNRLPRWGLPVPALPAGIDHGRDQGEDVLPQAGSCQQVVHGGLRGVPPLQMQLTQLALAMWPANRAEGKPNRAESNSEKGRRTAEPNRAEP